MPNHKQPTKEELEAKVKEATEIPEEEINKPTEEEEDENPEVVTPPAEEAEEEEPTPDEEKEEEQAEPSKEIYKKKFSASSRENQRISAKNRVINQALIQADDIPEPTEEELTKEYPDWDVMSEVEKSLAKETVISRNWRKVISEAKNQATKIEKWNESVDTFVDDPSTLIDNPSLEGKIEEFKEFATIEENNSVPFKILVSAFLHDQTTKKPNNKGRMFERGSGGPNEKPTLKKDTITLDEARKLRVTDYNKWKEYNQAGKIEMDL